jgi:carboxypeptidase C (cathepsin A)
MGDTIKDRTHNDYSQSLDSFNALVKWYSLYPEFKNNPLFISGESYGGIYVPYLAWQIY